MQLKLTARHKRKILREARDNPMVIIDAIQEAIEISKDPQRLEELRERYRKWVMNGMEMPDDEVIEVFLASKCPNPDKYKKIHVWLRGR